MDPDDSPTIVDASVVVKWFVSEREMEPARSLRDEYVNGAVQLAAPAVMPFEVTNALRYSDLLDDSELERAATSLSKYGIDLVPFAAIDGVVSAAQAVDIPIYDASYVALAYTMDSRLYTADAQLVDSTADTKYQVNVVHIDDFGA